MEVQKYDTIIIGGGIAGLTAAAFLARAGQKTLLLEKNQEFGGLVSSFQADGFHFEAGVRALESAGIILPMLENLGIQLEMVRSKVSIGIQDKILNIEDLKTIQEYRNLLVSLYPESKAEIDTYIKAMRKIMRLLDVLYGIENPLFKDLKRDTRYIFKKLLPWLPKFLFTIGKINRLNKPFEIYLEAFIKNPSLRDIISQHFFKATPAFFALSYFSLYLDYFYPKGGVGKIAEAMVNKIREFRGELVSNTFVKEVYPHQKYVADQNNKRYYYHHLIWAADLKTFYSITRTDELGEKIQRNFLATRDRVMVGRGSESVFSVYIEADLPPSYFAGISHGHFFYTPLKDGLGNIHRDELKMMLNHWDTISKSEVSAWLNRFLNYNTFEISIPGLKDASLVPEDKTGLIISFIIEYELFKKLEDAGWYDDVRQETEARIIQILSESVYPKLRGKVLKHFSLTPISIRNRIASTDGAIVGWSFQEQVPVVSKIQRSDKSVVTPIPGIYQAGQWAYSPAGVPMSILTGKLAADRICKTG